MQGFPGAAVTEPGQVVTAAGSENMEDQNSTNHLPALQGAVTLNENNIHTKVCTFLFLAYSIFYIVFVGVIGERPACVGAQRDHRPR